MPALPLIAKTIDEKAEAAPSPRAEFASTRDAIFIPPPLPTKKATLAQVRASLEISLAQASAGLLEDADVVQARMRAKYGIHGKGEVRH